MCVSTVFVVSQKRSAIALSVRAFGDQCENLAFTAGQLFD